MGINYASYYDRPEMIRICEHCTKPDCEEGICLTYKNALREMLGEKKLEHDAVITKPPKLGTADGPENRRYAKRAHNGGKRAFYNQCYEYNGETHTLQEWANVLGVPYNTLYMRLWRFDISFAEAAEFKPMRPVRKAMTITANGETLTIKQWAAKLGIQPRSIYARVKRGYTLEQAVTVGRMV